MTDQAKAIEALKAKYPRRNPGGVLIDYNSADIHEAIDRAVSISRASQGSPIDMVLFCPACGVQHIDEVEAVLVWTGGAVPEPSHEEITWDNPPHRSHLCGACGCIWRPADVATNGVKSIQTKGKADTFDPAVDRPLSRASQGSGAGTEDERLRVARALFDLREDDEANWSSAECREVHLIEADAAIAALSPPAAPQDSRKAYCDMADDDLALAKAAIDCEIAQRAAGWASIPPATPKAEIGEPDPLPPFLRSLPDGPATPQALEDVREFKCNGCEDTGEIGDFDIKTGDPDYEPCPWCTPKSDVNADAEVERVLAMSDVEIIAAAQGEESGAEYGRRMLAGAHLLATPVTVTMEECYRLGWEFIKSNKSSAPMPVVVAEALRRVLGDRIQIAGEPS